MGSGKRDQPSLLAQRSQSRLSRDMGGYMMTDWIIERCMQTGAMVRILADEEGTREIHWKPDPKGEEE